jgi:type III secretion protein V
VVIGGNLIVGLVVFLVITLIQFIVIAKGSERVAEVSARFTLDALPGKQMSIDADVRAGLIDFETARLKRQELQTESRFYGALDGAMKFIKGDAIAGLVITAINLVGGLIIGVLVQELSIGEAVQRYSLLTVGDGLVSQIPALLNSLAAGLVVTRVTRGDGASLASEVLGQLGQLQGVKILIGVISLLMALAPGMPSFPCVLIGAALMFLGLMQTAHKGSSEKESEMRFEPKLLPLIMLELSRTQAEAWVKNGQVSAEIERFRQELYEQCGLILARPELKVLETGRAWRIKLRGNLARQAQEGQEIYPTKEILESLKAVIVERLPELIDDILTRRTLDFLEKDAPELVSSVVPGLVSVTQLTEVLRGLCREGVTLRNFDLIVQALAETAPKVKGERALLEEVRVALARSVVAPHLDQAGVLRAYSIDPVLDLSLVKAEREGAVLDSETLKDLFKALLQEDRLSAPLVVSKGARRLLKDCLDVRAIKCTVLAHEEIPAEVKFENLGLIGFENEEMAEREMQRLAA